MRGAINPLHHYAFMAWCSVKTQYLTETKITIKKDRVLREYLELRGRKWRETRENCIMRSFIFYMKPRVKFTRYNIQNRAWCGLQPLF
jgi:hypothetical protein